jgi:hypothetical protein
LRFRWAVKADWHARAVDTGGAAEGSHLEGLRRAQEALAG